MGATVHFPPFTRSLAYLFGTVSDNWPLGHWPGGHGEGRGRGRGEGMGNRTKARGWLQARSLLAREEGAEGTGAGGRSGAS